MDISVLEQLGGQLAQYAAIVVAIIGGLVFLVSVIVEVIKNLPPFNRVPTDYVVVALSEVLTLAALYAGAAVVGYAVTWYIVVAAVIIGFVVALVAMSGWSKIKELWSRSRKSE